MAIKYQAKLKKLLKENNSTILDKVARISKLLKIEYYTDFSSQRRNKIEIITNDNQCFILKNLKNPSDVFYQILRNAYNVKYFENITESVKNSRCIQQGVLNQMIINNKNKSNNSDY